MTETVKSDRKYEIIIIHRVQKKTYVTIGFDILSRDVDSTAGIGRLVPKFYITRVEVYVLKRVLHDYVETSRGTFSYLLLKKGLE